MYIDKVYNAVYIVAVCIVAYFVMHMVVYGVLVVYDATTVCTYIHVYTTAYKLYTHYIHYIYCIYYIGVRVPRAYLDRSGRGGPKKEPGRRYAVYILYTYTMHTYTIHTILYYTSPICMISVCTYIFY